MAAALEAEGLAVEALVVVAMVVAKVAVAMAVAARAAARVVVARAVAVMVVERAAAGMEEAGMGVVGMVEVEWEMVAMVAMVVAELAV